MSEIYFKRNKFLPRTLPDKIHTIILETVEDGAARVHYHQLPLETELLEKKHQLSSSGDENLDNASIVEGGARRDQPAS